MPWLTSQPTDSRFCANVKTEFVDSNRIQAYPSHIAAKKDRTGQTTVNRDHHFQQSEVSRQNLEIDNTTVM